MMKKRTFRFLLLWLLSCCGPAFMGAGNDNPLLPAANAQTLCPAPTPGWIVATGVTANSVSLAWEPNAYTTYYRVEGFDVGLGQAVPTNYVNSPSITINNLQDGHTYQFTVSASYCPDGGWSEGIMVEITTGFIVIENIVEFQAPCEQFRTYNTSRDMTLNFCVRESYSANSPFATGMLAKIDNAVEGFWFGLAVSDYTGRIGPNSLNQGGGENFWFAPVPPPDGEWDSYVECWYTGETSGNTHLFTIDYVDCTYAGYVDFSITFHGDYSFRMCNTCVPPGKRESETGSGLLAEAQTSVPSDITLLLPPSPNPFSESATLVYERNKTGPTQIMLYDAMGRLAQTVSNETQEAPGEYTATISGEELPDGVYFLHMVTGEGKKVFPLVKRR